MKLKGNRTKITAATGIAVSVAQYFGVIIPEPVVQTLVFVGLYFLRLGVGK